MIIAWYTVIFCMALLNVQNFPDPFAVGSFCFCMGLIAHKIIDSIAKGKGL